MATHITSHEPVETETPLSWLVWSLGCIFYFYEFLLQVSPSVMGQQLMHDFNVSANALGILSGVYFYSYGAMQVPAGVLLDKYGPHRLLTLATAICAIASIAFGLTTSLFMASIARFCIGFGSAFAVVGTMKLAANWFPTKRFALLTGLMVAIGMSGAIGGEAPLARFIHTFGWRHSMVMLGIAGLVVALLIYLIAQDKPKPAVKTQQQKAPSKKNPISIWQGLCQIVKKPQIWLVATYGGLMYMATPVLCGLWGVPYLKQKFMLDDVGASGIISYVFVGWIIGSPLWGYVSDRMGKRKPPMLIGSIMALILMMLILYVDINNLTLLKGMLFLFGIASCGFLTAFSIAKESTSTTYTATAMSFMNMMNTAGVALAQPLIGFLLDRLWQGGLDAEQVRVYTTSNYEIAISILPIGILIALMLLPFIKETYCHSIEQDLSHESK